jgi:hypothetical protein
VIDPQADDPALAGGQRPHRPLEQVAVFGGREARLLGGEHATGREALAACVLGRGVGLDERLRRVGATGRDRLGDPVLALAGGLGQLLERRRAAEPVAHALAHGGHAPAQILQGARDTHSPAAVAEEVHDLTVDRPGRVRPQRHAAGGVVAVDRLDQADVARLLDVLERQAAAVVAARDRAHQARVPHHQLLAGCGVATLAMRGDQLDVGAM